MAITFGQVRVNGVWYPVMAYYLEIFNRQVGRYAMRKDKPLIGGCRRNEIYFSWCSQEWFKNEVKDFTFKKDKFI